MALSNSQERLNRSPRPRDIAREKRVQDILDSNRIGIMVHDDFTYDSQAGMGSRTYEHETESCNYALFIEKSEGPRYLFIHGREMFAQQDAECFFDQGKRDIALLRPEAVERYRTFFGCTQEEAQERLLGSADRMLNPYSERATAIERGMAETAEQGVRREMLPFMMHHLPRSAWIFSDNYGVSSITNAAGIKEHTNTGLCALSKHEDSDIPLMAAHMRMDREELSAVFAHEAGHFYDVHRRQKSFASMWPQIRKGVKEDNEHFNAVEERISQLSMYLMLQLDGFSYPDVPTPTSEDFALLQKLVRISTAPSDKTPTLEDTDRESLRMAHNQTCVIMDKVRNIETALHISVPGWNGGNDSEKMLDEVPALLEEFVQHHGAAFVKELLPNLYDALKENRHTALAEHRQRTQKDSGPSR